MSVTTAVDVQENVCKLYRDFVSQREMHELREYEKARKKIMGCMSRGSSLQLRTVVRSLLGSELWG
jgi:hypothetical protein